MPTRVGDYFVAVRLGQFLGMHFQDERKMSKSGGSIQAESAHEMEFLLQSRERFWSNVACCCCRVTKLLQINQVRKLDVKYCEKKKKKTKNVASFHSTTAIFVCYVILSEQCWWYHLHIVSGNPNSRQAVLNRFLEGPQNIPDSPRCLQKLFVVSLSLSLSSLHGSYTGANWHTKGMLLGWCLCCVYNSPSGSLRVEQPQIHKGRNSVVRVRMRKIR